MRSSVVALLRAKNDCSNWFNTGRGSAPDVMSDVRILLADPTPGPLSGPDSGTPQGPFGPITVYPDERFYSAQCSKNNLPVGGVYQPGSYGARMIILLHELAHKVYLVRPDGPLSEGPTNQSELNTKIAMGHCRSAVDSGTY
jgi:hypothetical protein